MGQNNTRAIINFTDYIVENSRNFTGREWVFQAINDWLADPDGSRFFLLSGEPGSGKTAIASRLSQFSQGMASPPEELAQLGRDFLSAIHFCSASDGLWIDPLAFSGSVATQLANRYPFYMEALNAHLRPDQPIRIHVEQVVQEIVNGQMIGVAINVRGLSVESAFNQVVRQPLEALLQQELNKQVVILVDALDEALNYSGTSNIVSLLTTLANLTVDARFIVTSRPRIEVLRPLLNLGSSDFSLTSELGLNYSQEDIRQYTISKLVAYQQFAAKLTVAGLTLTDFLKKVQEKTAGNFLYVEYLLKMLMSQEEDISPESLDMLPEGLDGIYIEFLERLIAKEREAWEEKYAPLLGTLAAAKQPLNEEQLAGIVDMNISHARQILFSLSEFLRTDKALLESQRTYSIYHRSFADFLLDRERAQEFWCEEALQHERIAKFFLTNYSDEWLSCEDEYALRYVLYHLVEVIRLLERPSQRHRRIQFLGDLNALINRGDFSVARFLRIERGAYFHLDFGTINRDFVGRDWVFQRLNAWLQAPSQRVFLLTGPPASGKTYLAGRLALLSSGEIPCNGFQHLGPDRLICAYISVISFSSSLDQSLYGDHSPFFEELCWQLAALSRQFASALAQSYNQQLMHMATLPVSVSEIESEIRYDLTGRWSFEQMLRQPLMQLYAAGLKQKIIMVVDGLDEVAYHQQDALRKTLMFAIHSLPDQVCFVFIGRTMKSNLWLYPADKLSMDLMGDAPQGVNERDVRSYLYRQLSLQPGLSESQRKAVVDQFAPVANGNLFFAGILLTAFLHSYPANFRGLAKEADLFQELNQFLETMREQAPIWWSGETWTKNAD